MHVNDLNYRNYTPPKSFIRRLLTSLLFLASIGLLLVGALVWYIFDSSIQVNEKDLPLIKAEPGALKYRPPNAGELTVPHQDKLIYSRLVGGEDEKPIQEKFLPLPEKPLAGLPVPGAIPPGDEVPADDHPDAIASSETKAAASALSTSSNLSNDEIASLISAIDESTASDTPLVAEPAKKFTHTPAVKTEPSVFYRIQLGNFPTLEKAKIAWQALSTQHKKATKGITPSYIKGNDKKSTLYTLQAGPFKQKQQAQDICRIIASAKGSKASAACRVIVAEKKK